MVQDNCTFYTPIGEGLQRIDGGALKMKRPRLRKR